MIIKANLKLYNLGDINMSGELSTLDTFYFYNKKKINTEVINKQNNYFFYLNHNNLFKDNPLFNLILFVSSNGNLLDNFVYGIEIQKEFSRRDDISSGTLTIDKINCFYYILDTKEFPTFILNSNNDDFKKITSVFHNNNSWENYTTYDYIKVLQYMSRKNDIQDISDENYNLLMSDNKYSETCENPIENFEKYRVLNLSKKDKIKKCIKMYSNTKIIEMLIETYKYYDLNITNIEIEDELSNLLNDIGKKELFELFFNKLLDS